MGWFSEDSEFQKAEEMYTNSTEATAPQFAKKMADAAGTYKEAERCWQISNYLDAAGKKTVAEKMLKYAKTKDQATRVRRIAQELTLADIEAKAIEAMTNLPTFAIG